MANDLTGQKIQNTYQRVIHTDGTNTYNGTGSALPILFDGNNVIISGTLTAQTYVVSESVINVSSGSTIFGNSADDTHTFTGAITSSGNISSSGNIYGLTGSFGNIDSKGDIILGFGKKIIAEDNYGNRNDIIAQGAADTTIAFGDAESTTNISGEDINLTSEDDITLRANGNSIALSDGTTRISFGVDSTPTFTFTLNPGEIIASKGLTLSANITASSNIEAAGQISASGDVIGNNIIGTINGGYF